MSKKHGLDFDHGCWELPSSSSSSLEGTGRSSSSATLNEDSDCKQTKFYPLKEVDKCIMYLFGFAYAIDSPLEYLVSVFSLHAC